MIKLLRLLQGYVLFEATGGFSERFVNLCKINSIVLWGMENDGVKVKAFTTLSCFQKLDLVAEKSGMTVNAISRKGLPTFINSHKWRLGAVIGLVFIVVVIWFLSGYIWSVEIVPDGGVKINGFTEAIEEIGIKTGARKSEIDIVSIQEELMNRFPELSWVSVNIFGSKAQVEYIYAAPQKKIIDASKPSNLVASKDGKIVLVDGYSGVNKIKVGDNVVKDSLLISGVVKKSDLSEYFVRAQGRVLAETKNKLSFSCDLEAKAFIVKSVKPSYKLNFFFFTIPLGLQHENKNSYSVSVPLKGNETDLPVGIIRVDNLEATQADIVLSSSRAMLDCLLQSVLCKRDEYGDADVKSVTFTAMDSADSVTLESEILCIEDIALEKELLIEEN